MSFFWLILSILAVAAIGYVAGRARASRRAGGNNRNLHSLPSYYGANVALKSTAPAMLLLAVWLIAQPIYVNGLVSSMLPNGADRDGVSRELAIAEARRTARGLDLAVERGRMDEEFARNAQVDIAEMTAGLKASGALITSEITRPALQAAQRYRSLNTAGDRIGAAAVIAAAVLGALWGLGQTQRRFRARNVVERGVEMILIAAASIAILTTLGIALSVLFNAIEFFGLYPARDFFLGLRWAPSFSGRGGSSELSVMPLLWGTLYISTIALLVAVPLGLFSAIYLSEYAGPRARAVTKPMLEVLAGIPTVVYGLFALLTVGPLLVSVFGAGGLLGVDWQSGGRSVATAGLVMGIMLIPFVSSLSDDIISAVPRAMRDGSYGLGATQSETIRLVVLPAALPGIVGAILLAASRAIGETMIVVLGAGAAARLSLNPFEAMTTVTAKIVSQLTGDSDFASPEALVAFALGATLFVITLALNVFALYVVRKYREQVRVMGTMGVEDRIASSGGRTSLRIRNDRTKRRRAAEMRFRACGIAAIAIGLFFLVAFATAIIRSGAPAFTRAVVDVTLALTHEKYEFAESQLLKTATYEEILVDEIRDLLGEMLGEGAVDAAAVRRIIGKTGGAIREFFRANEDQIGQPVEFTLAVSSRVDGYIKGRVSRDSVFDSRFLMASDLDLVDSLSAAGVIRSEFNWGFITGADSGVDNPGGAGIGAAVVGSFFMMLVVLGLSLPIGVAASIYLEEFAPRNRVTDLIEVNISNLAAVPSIVFGILGLAVFIQFFHLPQSAPLVGGLVLTLMTLPTIIISTRASLKAVPPWVRDAALALGASKMQAVFHHVLPLAMPGILTGTIIGLAQALGETGPLLLIGMVGLIARGYPDSFLEGFTDPNSAIPAQIYTWASRADPGFYEKAWGGIIVLLIFLLSMNIVAIFLRRGFERRW